MADGCFTELHVIKMSKRHPLNVQRMPLVQPLLTVFYGPRPVKKEGKPRKKLKLPDAVGAGAWMEYWENQKKIKLLKEENKRKRLEKKKEREDELKKKQTEKELKKENIEKKKKKKEQFSSSSVEDNCLMEIEELSDLDIGLAEILEPRTPTPTEELDRDPLENNYALIKFPFEGRNKEAHYVGKILSVKGREISVSCLRKSKKFENKYSFFHKFRTLQLLTEIK